MFIKLYPGNNVFEFKQNYEKRLYHLNMLFRSNLNIKLLQKNIEILSISNICILI